MTTLREALAAATDSAGRIHSTRALALAIDEADALLAHLSENSYAYSRGYGDGRRETEAALEEAMRERNEARRERDSYQRAAHTAAEALGRMMGERDEARADAKKVRVMLDEVTGRAFGDDAYIIGLATARRLRVPMVDA
jgi:chromosome segregation ATPase